MKVLLVCEQEEVKNHLVELGKDYDIEVIWYRDPIKGMDNLDETDPEALVLSAVDFPRHWKVFHSFLLATFSRTIPTFLIIDRTFDREERRKGEFLGVEGFLEQDLSPSEGKEKLLSLLKPPLRGGGRDTGVASPKRTYWEPPSQELAQILFLHPETYRFVEGTITRIEGNTLYVRPFREEKTKDLTPPLLLPGCSLRIENQLFELDLELLENSDPLVFKFISIPRELRNRLGGILLVD